MLARSCFFDLLFTPILTLKRLAVVQAAFIASGVTSNRASFTGSIFI